MKIRPDFPFVINTDVSLSMVVEMVAELDITDHEVTHIAELFDDQVGALLLA